MFENIKEEATRKFCELKLWVANIDITNDYNVITRGLFFVYVYGIYEGKVGWTKLSFIEYKK